MDIKDTYIEHLLLVFQEFVVSKFVIVKSSKERKELRDMKKKDLIKYLEDNCTDFLNFKKETVLEGETYHGFYVEIEDVADMMLKVKEK